MEYYKLTINNRQFSASVNKLDEHWIEILVGGAKIKCVTIHVYIDDNTASLASIHHDDLCVLDGTLPTKVGTHDLLTAALQLCIYLYPAIPCISLQDESTIKCGDGQHLPLPEVYMMLYGETWYQKMFNAQPKHDKKTMHHIQQRLLSKPDVSFEVLWSRYFSKGYPNNKRKTIHDLYISSTSWCEFFRSIRHNNCEHWQAWIYKFFKETFHMSIRGTTWIIKPPNDTSIVIEKSLPPKVTLKPRYTGIRLFGGGGAIMRWEDLD